MIRNSLEKTDLGKSLIERLEQADYVSTDAFLLALAAVLIIAPIGMITGGFYIGYPSFWVLIFEVGITYLLYSLVILGLNLQYGVAGLVNFGPVLFYAIGMYGTAVLAAENSYRGASFGLHWAASLPIAVLLAGFVGLVVGITTIRLRGDFLGIVTLAGAEIFYVTVLSLDFFGSGFTITGAPRILADAAPTQQMGQLSYVLVYGGIVLIAYVAVKRLTGSPYGRTLRAIRADEDVVKSIGKTPLRYNIVTFVFGAMLAGLAGSLYALFIGGAIPGEAAIRLTMIVWVAMLIGGPGNHLGVLGGLLIVESIQLSTRFLGTYTAISGTNFASLRFIILGALLILVIRYRPEGLWGDAEKLGRYES